MLRTLLLALSLTIAVSSASASVIPVLDTVTLVGTEYEFSYSGTLAGDTGFVDGNRLVILDFAGYVDGSISSGIYAADLDAYVELTSSVLLPPGYDDDPNVENLVFEWAGAPFNASGGPFADVSFAGVTARSIYSVVGIDTYSATSTINNGAATGLTAYNQGPVGVPVPEPGIAALLVAGVGLVAARSRSRA